MIKPVKAVIPLIFSINAYSQPKSAPPVPEFEGVIRYTVQVKSNGTHTADNLQKEWGDTMIFYYKQGNYHMQFNGQDLADVFYVAKENVEYTWRRNRDSIFAGDSYRQLDSLYGISSDTSTLSVAGYSCRQVRIFSNNFTRHFWYSPQLQINPAHFKNFRLGLLGLYYNEAKAPFLRSEYHSQFFSIIYTAFSVEKRQVTPGEMKLPPLPVTKNYR